MKIKSYGKILMSVLLFVMLFGCQNEKHDAILKVGVSSLSGTFNPVYTASLNDSYVNDLVFETLIGRDENGNRCGRLAESYEISDDYRTMSFTLRENAVFSNGEKLTSDDVIFTFQVLADPSYDGPFLGMLNNLEGANAYYRGEVDDISGMEKVDESHLRFHFIEGYRSNLDVVSSVGILSKKFYPDYEKGNLESIKQSMASPVGSGPYQLENWSSDNGALLVKNPYYQGDGYTIATIAISEIGNDKVYEALDQGTIDAIFGVKDHDLIEKVKTNDHLQYLSYDSASISWITLNSGNGVTSDAKVREALSLGFDATTFVEHYYGDETYAYVPAIFQNPASLLKPYVNGEIPINKIDRFSIVKANQRLEESGWLLNKDGYRYKNGEPLEIRFLYAQEQGYADALITQLKETWEKQLHCKVSVASLSYESMLNKVLDDSSLNEWNAFMLGTSFSSEDLDSIYTMLHSSYAGNGGSNLARLKNQEIDALLEEGRMTFQEDKMKEIYLELAEKVQKEYVYLPVVVSKNFDIYNQRLQGLRGDTYYPWTYAIKDVVLNS